MAKFSRRWFLKGAGAAGVAIVIPATAIATRPPVAAPVPPKPRPKPEPLPGPGIELEPDAFESLADGSWKKRRRVDVVLLDGLGRMDEETFLELKGKKVRKKARVTQLLADDVHWPLRPGTHTYSGALLLDDKGRRIVKVGFGNLQTVCAGQITVTWSKGCVVSISA